VPAPGGICERGLCGRVYGRCSSLFVLCSGIEAFLSRAAVSLCCHPFRAPGHKFYLEIAYKKIGDPVRETLTRNAFAVFRLWCIS